ncbi:hypothetical protein HY625_01640 [Candidatus Uhrbacteria bacterium]|nr:hypothetical protein [Candidatus Uhrbacteria bacterium]
MHFQRGFSLLELIIYIGITIMIVATLAEMTVVMLRVRERNIVRQEVEQNLRFVMSRLETALTQATAIVGTPGSTLELTIGGVSTTFSLVSGVLKIDEGGGAGAIALTTDKVTVSALGGGNMFTKVSNPSPAKDSVQIKIKIDYVAGSKTSLTASASAQTTVELRQI